MRTAAVVGASLAGLSTARALRQQGFDGRLVIVGDEPHRPYDRPPLSKDFLAGKTSDIGLGTPDDEGLDLDWRLGARALRLDARDRSIELSTGQTVRCDGVVIATGARARWLPGTEGVGGVHVLRTLDDAIRLRADLVPGVRLVVVGAGFIGAEVASTARHLGADVTVIEAEPLPLLPQLGKELGMVCAGLHADHGVELITGVPVRRILGESRVHGVELADGRHLRADVVVVGIGAVPNVEWLDGSGLELGNGVVTDAACATGLPEVVAVGDVAASYSVHLHERHRSEHWTNALEQPATAAATLLGAPRPHLSVPYFWSDQYGVRIQFAGTRRDGDTVRVIEGDVDRRSFLAVYERRDLLVGVLGMNQPKLFSRWRRQLARPVLAP
ncbi:NAD(P)/FAD-dependent oxidoreductase [Kutzneria sp. NPDC052558]|uniref:NAD(P)/FAD-dependent oxidoreductase n=1 Tax=Kutzneria sp. NPDC052558 TaxID=3364121 RepID=UPI0037C686A9